MTKIKAVVLAAGKGTRMMTEENTLPKVLREACGKPLLYYVLKTLQFVKKEDTILVVGYRKEDVLAAFPDYPYAVQAQQLGTGHAVLSAAPQLQGFDGTVLVCYGDMPLLREEAYRGLLKHHEETGAVCTLLSGTTEEDLPYGRVQKAPDGTFLRVIEARDCTEEELAIRELNVGIYAFDCKVLLDCLGRLRSDNAQHEYYLTDVPALIRQDGGKVAVYTAALNEQILGVNTPEQLSMVERYLMKK